jgi:hypothetical protein
MARSQRRQSDSPGDVPKPLVAPPLGMERDSGRDVH